MSNKNKNHSISFSYFRGSRWQHAATTRINKWASWPPSSVTRGNIVHRKSENFRKLTHPACLPSVLSFWSRLNIATSSHHQGQRWKSSYPGRRGHDPSEMDLCFSNRLQEHLFIIRHRKWLWLWYFFILFCSSNKDGVFCTQEWI